MIRSRVVVVSLGVLASACVGRPNTGTSPMSVPRGSVYAQYTGGLTNRTLDARFQVDQDAYVMIGHLAGDGVIRILYPESPKASAKVRAKEWQRSRSTVAYYDAVPSLYAFTPVTYRLGGARMDSYDGLGHAFVFMITSKKELDFDAVSDKGFWNNFEVPDYTRLPDPRDAVREFAELVADGPYALQFASSFRTVAMTDLAQQSFDCAVLGSLTSLSMASLYQTGFFNYGIGRSYCGGGSSYALFFYPRPWRYGQSGGWLLPATTVINNPVTRPSTRTRARPQPGRTMAEPRVVPVNAFGTTATRDRYPDRRTATRDPFGTDVRNGPRTTRDPFPSHAERRSANSGPTHPTETRRAEPTTRPVESRPVERTSAPAREPQRSTSPVERPRPGN